MSKTKVLDFWLEKMSDINRPMSHSPKSFAILWSTGGVACVPALKLHHYTQNLARSRESFTNDSFHVFENLVLKSLHAAALHGSHRLLLFLNCRQLFVHLFEFASTVHSDYREPMLWCFPQRLDGLWGQTVWHTCGLVNEQRLSVQMLKVMMKVHRAS